MNSQSNKAPILVMGGNGRVGCEVVSYLLRHTSHDIIIASRSGTNAQLPSPRVRGMQLDAFDHHALTQAFDGLALVIACIGPSGLIGDRVARACCESGTPLIDAGGYDPLLDSLTQRQASKPIDVPLIISVGLMPGLTGLFPKYVVDCTSGGRTPQSLNTYCIGRDAWTYNSAWDIVHSLGDFGQDRGFPVIRNGQHRSVGFFKATRKTDFGAPIGRVTTMLMPSEELARLARQLKVREARAYGSNVGPRAAMACMVAKMLGQYRTPEKIDRAARRLVKASTQDMKRLKPVYGLKVDVTYTDDHSESATLIIADTYQATGAVIAIAARCLLEGHPVANGVQMLHEAMDSRHFMHLLGSEGLFGISGLEPDASQSWQGSLS